MHTIVLFFLGEMVGGARQIAIGCMVLILRAVDDATALGDIAQTCQAGFLTAIIVRIFSPVSVLGY